MNYERQLKLQVALNSEWYIVNFRETGVQKKKTKTNYHCEILIIVINSKSYFIHTKVYGYKAF